MSPRTRVASFVAVALLTVLGCASAPTTQGTSATPAHRRFALAFDEPADRRDFSRVDIVAPELKAIFDPTRDVYVLDTGKNPYNLEFVAGSTFRWDGTAGAIAQNAVRDELQRSDWVRWARPLPVSEPPDYLLHVNVLEFHYLRTEQAYFPQVSVDLLIVDPKKGETVARLPARITNEFSVTSGVGQRRIHTFVVEDWMERDLRDEMRRALERVGEKLTARAEEFFADRAAGKPLRPME